MSAQTPSLGTRPKDLFDTLSQLVQFSDQNNNPLEATVSTACKTAETVSARIREMVNDEENVFTTKQLWGLKGKVDELRKTSELVMGVIEECYPALESFIPEFQRFFMTRLKDLVLGVSKLTSHLDETLEILDRELAVLEWVQVEAQRAAREGS